MCMIYFAIVENFKMGYLRMSCVANNWTTLIEEYWILNRAGNKKLPYTVLAH